MLWYTIRLYSTPPSLSISLSSILHLAQTSGTLEAVPSDIAAIVGGVIAAILVVILIVVIVIIVVYFVK